MGVFRKVQAKRMTGTKQQGDSVSDPGSMTEGARHAGQILDGAKMIAEYLSLLGFEMTERRVFHWAADGRLPVKKIGMRLIANKRTLLHHFGLDE
jgi:hypothetical protein